MISKKYRLNTEDFEKTMLRGSSFTSRFFYLKTTKNNLGSIRIGVAISKKLADKITTRNYYKRILRHILKNNLSDFKFSYDIVLIAKLNIKGEKFKSLSEDAKSLLQKAKIFK